MVSNKKTVKNRLTLTLWMMHLEEQKQSILFVCSAVTSWNIQISTLTKLTYAINELSISIYLSMPRTKTNLVKGDFDWAANTGTFKIIRRTWKMAKWDFTWISMLEKEEEDSWLNAIKIKIAFVKYWLNLSSKITTAANAHLMESLLDNWLKNNYITVDIILCLGAVYLSLGSYTSFSFQANFSTVKWLQFLSSIESARHSVFISVLKQLENILRYAFASGKTNCEVEIKKINYLSKLFS